MNTTQQIDAALRAMVLGEEFTSKVATVRKDIGFELSKEPWALAAGGGSFSFNRLLYVMQGGVFAHHVGSCSGSFARPIVLRAGIFLGVEIPPALFEPNGPYHVNILAPLGLAALRAALSTTVVEP